MRRVGKQSFVKKKGRSSTSMSTVSTPTPTNFFFRFPIVHGQCMHACMRRQIRTTSKLCVVSLLEMVGQIEKDGYVLCDPAFGSFSLFLEILNPGDN